MTRSELIKKANLSSGGTISKVLNELKHSGFVGIYQVFNKKKKDQLFRLTDEYSLFYLQFIEDHLQEEQAVWQRLSQTRSYKSWSGYAYENICLKHLSQIKKALGISGVYSTSSTFTKKGTSTNLGTQIDLLIDRNDHVINLFEIKFYNNKFTLDKNTADNLRGKMRIFQEKTKTNKQLFWGVITTFGITPSQHSIGLIQQVITLVELFEE